MFILLFTNTCVCMCVCNCCLLKVQTNMDDIEAAKARWIFYSQLREADAGLRSIGLSHNSVGENMPQV